MSSTNPPDKGGGWSDSQVVSYALRTVLEDDSINVDYTSQNSDHEKSNNVNSLLRKLEIKDICVNFLWVKTHVGICGNEKADKLAKSASLNQVDQPWCLSFDILASVKTSIWNKWQNIYRSRDKANYYKNINPLPSNALCPLVPNRYGYREDPLCTCGEIGTVDHLHLWCSNHPHQCDIFLSNMNKITMYNMPFNLNLLLATNNLGVYKALYDHVKFFGLNI
ncbi:hypothetical protein WA026_012329 [Henosepilachna vigintioctopunctata]|uniref:RNase H type-1 domain-containing protein n=1 Tax=Henosepilachna vigintioctopunctata TaxID=420089 RepID=A0AAW1UQY5_9CUCU